MEDNFKTLLFTHKEPRNVVRSCLPELVKKLDLEPVLDHVIAADVLTEENIDQYELKKDEPNHQQQLINRWFLRRIVLKGSDEVIAQ